MSTSIVRTVSESVPKGYIEKVKKGNRPEFSYVPIDKVILLLNQRLEDRWNVDITNMQYIPGNEPSCIVTVNLTVTNEEGQVVLSRSGIGADIHKPGREGRVAPIDPDKIVKTAYANALKKAANLLGLGLELWDEQNVLDPSEHSSESSSQQEPTPVLSPVSREKVETFCEKTGLTKGELTEYLKRLIPESQGNPAYLAIGEQDTNISVFLNKVEEELKAK